MNIYIELDHKATVLFVCNRLFLPRLVWQLVSGQRVVWSISSVLHQCNLLSVTSITRHSFVSILEVFTALAWSEIQNNEGERAAWHGGGLPTAGGREQGIYQSCLTIVFKSIWIYIGFQVVRRKALEALLKYVDEQDSWLEGEEEKLKAAGLKSLDDK